ncbi:MAG: DUF177 domain-containing protein [Deltaproteobacteria bacterium]|nr:DUF177 domain-containing protein [Deltaproteobacteria bacterium]
MARDLLKVRIDEIPDAGLDVSIEKADERFAALVAGLAQGPGEQTGKAQVRLELWPKRIDAIGSFAVTVPQVCVRCLEPFVMHLEHQFTQYLMRTSADDPEEAGDGEIELSLRDLDRSSLVGDEVDLGGILQEELLLATPTKLVCKEECKGICGGCGAELNSEPCTCEPEIDPRWDALKALKLD